MGCNFSREKEEKEAAPIVPTDSSGGKQKAEQKQDQNQNQKPAEKSAASASAPAPVEPVKLDPKDFILSKLKDQTIIKEPGSIRGQQFVIEECENCTIYLLDHSATVSIDECTNCRIFVGPCESSVFVRTSKQMKLIIAAQQLRTRECSDIDLLLYVSAGQPVIEETKNVRLGCFHFNYFGLAEQFVAAGLDPWYSEWSNVHDFTASVAGGESGAGRGSWNFIDPTTKSSDLLPPLDQESPDLSCPGFVTPITWGTRPSPFASPSASSSSSAASSSSRCLVLVAPGSEDEVGFDLLEKCWSEFLNDQRIILVRSRRVRLTPNKLQLIIDAASDDPTHKPSQQFMTAFAPPATDKSGKKASKPANKNAPSAPALGFELQLQPDSAPELLRTLRTASSHHASAHKLFISDLVANKRETEVALDTFFENLAVM